MDKDKQDWEQLGDWEKHERVQAIADAVQQPPGPISDRLRADAEALARHGEEQELNVPGETRD